MNWTKEQEEIISLRSKPMTITARAGSGKTTTMLACTRPGDVVLSFNKKIADEISARGTPAHTWHGFFLSKLRSKGLRAGLSAFVDSNPMFDIMKEFNVPEARQKKTLRDAGKIIPILKENLVASPQEAEEFYEKFGIMTEPAMLWECYQRSIPNMRKRKISFADIFLLSLDLTNGVEAKAWIDEAQDTNVIQLALAKKFFKEVSFVGDPAQAIYGFRGAGHGSMDRIAEEYPNNLQRTLSISFRCASKIISEAQAFVPDIFPRSDAPEGIVDTVDRLPGSPDPACAVLCRKNAPLFRYLMILSSRGIPANFRDKEFLSRVLDMSIEISLAGSQSVYDTIMAMKNADSRKRALEIYEVAKLPDASRFAKEGMKEQRGVVQLSSIHASKGLEWPRVYLLETSEREGLLPWEKEEEKNLRYVAITRAINELYYVPEYDL